MLKRYWNVLATVLFALTIIFSFPPAAGAVQGDVSFLVTSQNYYACWCHSGSSDYIQRSITVQRSGLFSRITWLVSLGKH